MYINKKGKNQAEKAASQQEDKTSNFSEVHQNRIRLRTNPSLALSPKQINQNQKNVEKEKQQNAESGPEIMYIDYNQTDRRNPMMDYTDARRCRELTDNENLQGRNYPNSILTNIRKDIGSLEREGNSLANKQLPNKFDFEPEKHAQTVISLLGEHTSLFAASPHSKTLTARNQKKSNFNNNFNYFNMPFNPNTFNNLRNNENNFYNYCDNNNEFNEYSNQSSNLNTTKSEAAQTYISDSTHRRNFVSLNADSTFKNNVNNNPIIVKKMSPNRNVDMSNFHFSGQLADPSKMQQLKQLAVINERNNPNVNLNANNQRTRNENISNSVNNQNITNNKINLKPENYSLALETNEQLNAKYTNDLEKLIKFNKQYDNFKKYNSEALVANLPKEGNLYTTQTHILSPITKHMLEEQKHAVRQMNKLSSIMLKEAKQQQQPQTKTNLAAESSHLNTRTATVHSTSSDFQSKSSTRKHAIKSAAHAGKLIRITLAMLSNKGPNCEDRIITRQMRFEKGGVVDLAQPTVSKNRSAPKKIFLEVKKTNLRSPRHSKYRSSNSREIEDAAKTIQAWWRGILHKYKDIVDKSVVIQKSWRRYFVRKNLYFKLSAFYFYVFLFDKLESLMRRRSLLLGFLALYNLNAEKHDGLKQFRSVIKIQQVFRRFLKLKKQLDFEKISAAQRNSQKIASNLNKPVSIESKMKAKSQSKLLSSPLKDERIFNPEEQHLNYLIKNTANKKSITVNTLDADIENKSPNVKYFRSQLTFANEANEQQPKEKSGFGRDEALKLNEKLLSLRNKFFANALQNLMRKNIKANLAPFFYKWTKNAVLKKIINEKHETDAGKRLAASDITKAIIKKKYDLLLHNLRKTAEKPNWKSTLLSKGVKELFCVFEHRKQNAFEDLKKNILGEKPQREKQLPAHFLNKIRGMLLNKTSKKILNRKTAFWFRLWRKSLFSATPKTQEAVRLVNSIKLPLDKVLKQVFPKFILGLKDLKTQKNIKLLARLVSRSETKFKNINLPYYLNIWRNGKNKKQIENLLELIMRRMLISLNKKLNIRALSKHFIFWSAKAKEKKSVEDQISLSEAKNTQLSAMAKLAPALGKYLKAKAAKIAKQPLINFIKEKNRKFALLKCFKIIPFFEKFLIQKYLNKLKSNAAESQKGDLKLKLLKSLSKSIIEKSSKDALRKKLNYWWRCLNYANTASVLSTQSTYMLNIQALQNKNILETKVALEAKILKRDLDRALLFLIVFRKRFLTKEIRECVIKWRNNYFSQMLNERMKLFYAKALLLFRKRFCVRILSKKFGKWRVNNEEIYKDLLVCSARNIKSKVKNIFVARIKKYFDYLIHKMKCISKLNNNKSALLKASQLSSNWDNKILTKYFRNWNRNAVLTELSDIKVNLLSKILEKLVNKKIEDQITYKLCNYFNKWKDAAEQVEEKIKSLNSLINRYHKSANFHNILITKNVNNLVEIAKHFHQLRKKQAVKIGDFMDSVLAIYRRNSIMKRQKALFNVLLNMNFYEKMQILLASNRWRSKTVFLKNNEKATVLQDFFKKIFYFKNKNADFFNKANKLFDNFKKKIALRKIKNAAKVKNFASLLVKTHDYIPNELRKFNLIEVIKAWNQKAQMIRKNKAIDKIINLLRRLAVKNFVNKLKQKKHFLEQILRKTFKKYVNQKYFYLTEWLRNAMLSKLKENANITAKWLSNKFNAYKFSKAKDSLYNIFTKKLLKEKINIIKKLAKISRLVNTINRLTYKRNAQLVWKSLKKKYLNKTLAPILSNFIGEFRTKTLKNYLEKWRKNLTNLEKKAAKKIQSLARMLIAKLKTRRELNKKKLMLNIILKIYRDHKLAKQGYIYQWLNIIKNFKINSKINVIAKIVKARNEKLDYDRAIVYQKIKKVFRNHFIKNIKSILRDSAHCTKKLLNTLQNFNSKFEIRFALNNLLDFGNNSFRIALIRKLTGGQNKLLNNKLIRNAIEKWRTYSERIFQFALKLQKMRRGKVFRDFLCKVRKLNELFSLLSLRYLGDKQLKAVRVNQWANKIRYFIKKQKAIVIQNYMRQALKAMLFMKLQNLFNQGFKKRFVNSISLIAKMRKFKDALKNPLIMQALESIKRRFIFLMMKNLLLKSIGNIDQYNINIQKEEAIKAWRKQIIKFNEHEKSAAVLISAVIKAKFIRLRIKRIQEITVRLKLIISRAFLGEEGIKRCLLHNWNKNSNLIGARNSKEILSQHAKSILEKIKKEEKEKQISRKKEGLEKLTLAIIKNVARDLLDKMINKNKTNFIYRLNEIYSRTYRNNVSEAIKMIKFYGFFRVNLIKKIQKDWKNKNKLLKMLMKIHLMCKAIQNAADKEIALKRAFVSLWRLNLNKIKNFNKANVLQKHFKNFLNFCKKKREEAQSKFKCLSRRYSIRKNILDVFRKLKSMMKLKQIGNIIAGKQFAYLRLKSTILYIFNIFKNQFHKINLKVKSRFIKIWREQAIKKKEIESSQIIIRMLNEIRNRRLDNKLRERLIPLISNKIQKENQIKKKAISEWSRTAQIINIYEKAQVIDAFLTKKKRAFDIKNKWNRLVTRLYANKAVIATKLLKDKIILRRKTQPIINSIEKLNVFKNGESLIRYIKRKLIIELIQKAFSNSCPIADKVKLNSHLKHWSNNALKIKRKENALQKAIEIVKHKYLEISFRKVISAYDFKRYAILAKLILSHDALKRIKAKADSVKFMHKFSEKLVEAQELHSKSGTAAFKDKLYNLFVYKLFANMGAIFINLRNRLHKPAASKAFLENLKTKCKSQSEFKYTESFTIVISPKALKSEESYNQLITADKKQIEFNLRDAKTHNAKCLRLLICIFNKMAKQRKRDLSQMLLEMSALAKLKKVFSNRKACAFAKLKSMISISSKIQRTNMFVLLRSVYLRKVLNEIESVNKYLILNHMVKLATVAKQVTNARFLLKSLRVWKFKSITGKIKEEKISLLKDSLDKFVETVKCNLFEGPQSFSDQYGSFNKKLDLFADPKIRTMKKVLKNAINKYENEKVVNRKVSGEKINEILSAKRNGNLTKEKEKSENKEEFKEAKEQDDNVGETQDTIKM